MVHLKLIVNQFSVHSLMLIFGLRVRIYTAIGIETIDEFPNLKVRSPSDEVTDYSLRSCLMLDAES